MASLTTNQNVSSFELPPWLVEYENTCKGIDFNNNDDGNNNVVNNNNNNKKLKMQQQEKKKLQIHFHLYQPTLFLPKLQVDQLSFIFQSASKPFERAHIIEKIVTDHESNFRGRLKVKYTHGQQSTYYVRPKNIIKVIQTDTTTKYHHCIVTLCAR